MSDAIETWLAGLAPQTRDGVERLRAVVRSVDAPWEESIKWNAPSFAIGGQDRVTLGVVPKGGWRMVLHRGAAASRDDFVFTDATGLAKWPASDRGVIQFNALGDMEANAEALTRLVRDWVAATS